MFSEAIRKHVFPWLVWLTYRLWTATWRIRIVESDAVKKYKADGTPWVCAIWHGDEIAMVRFTVFYKVATMTSTSKDGELMDKVLRRLGVLTSRGSSTRGGANALKGIIRLTRQGYSPIVAVDGPKGPIYKVKPGVFELSRVCHIPIIPVGVYAEKKYTFHKAWNKAYLPLPFTRVSLIWGDPFIVPEGVDARDPALAESLAREIDALGRAAVKLFANQH